MRRERTLLQHEVDILNQKMTQELLALKDELKGMFDDRKMDVRMEQRAMESKVRKPLLYNTALLTHPSDPRVKL
jgi:Coiled-coil domain-containing protein 90-like